jgi:hypothetical protein
MLCNEPVLDTHTLSEADKVAATCKHCLYTNASSATSTD